MHACACVLRRQNVHFFVFVFKERTPPVLTNRAWLLLAVMVLHMALLLCVACVDDGVRLRRYWGYTGFFTFTLMPTLPCLNLCLSNPYKAIDINSVPQLKHHEHG